MAAKPRNLHSLAIRVLGNLFGDFEAEEIVRGARHRFQQCADYLSTHDIDAR